MKQLGGWILVFFVTKKRRTGFWLSWFGATEKDSSSTIYNESFGGTDILWGAICDNFVKCKNGTREKQKNSV